jgi:hypothetical protein
MTVVQPAKNTKTKRLELSMRRAGVHDTQRHKRKKEFENALKWHDKAADETQKKMGESIKRSELHTFWLDHKPSRQVASDKQIFGGVSTVMSSSPLD